MRKLFQDESGTSVLELALIAPFLGFLIMGIIDLGQGFARVFDLRQGVHRAVELIPISAPSARLATGEWDFDYARKEAAAEANVALGAVTLTQWLQCGAATEPVYDSSCVSGVDMSRYVRVQVSGTYTPSFPLGPLKHLIGANANGAIPLTSSASVRIQ